MKTFKKWLAFLLAAALLVTALAACGDKTSSSSKPAESTAGSSQAAPSEAVSSETADGEKKGSGETLQLVMPSNSTPFDEGISASDNFITNYWSENTGYQFDVVILPNINAAEKLNLMFSGGEIKGLVFEKDFTSPSRFYNQGMLQSFDDYMEGSYFFETFAQYQDKGQIDGQQISAIIPPDGIPCSSSLYVVRKDVLESIGITEQPKTFEEFDAMLHTIKDKTDMIPLGVYNSPSVETWDTIAALFGVSQSHNAWAVRDGNVVYRLTQPEGFDYLTYCKKLYDEGLIPSDCLSLTSDTLEQLYLSEKTATTVERDCWNQPTFMPASEEKGFDSRYMDYPTGYYGQTSTGNMDRFFSQNVYLSNKAENPQAYVDLLDFLAKPETIKVNNYGLEGEHYTEDADGNMTLTEAGENLQWAVYYRNIFLPEDWYQVYGINANWAEYYYPTERHSVGCTDFDPVEFMPQQAEDVTKQSELKETIIDQFYSKALTGEVELTQETFDAMVKDWEDAGGKDIADKYTEQYKALGSPDYSSHYMSYLPEDHPGYTGKYLWEGHE